MRQFIPLCLLVVSVLIPCRIFSQKHLVPGKVILKNGDTLSGQIDNREWFYSPEWISFTNVSGSETFYSPDDISGFIILPDVIYRSKRCSLDLSNIKPEEVMKDDKLKTVNDTMLFVRLIAEGKASLFFFKDRLEKDHFYIEKAGELPVELRIRKTYRGTDELTGKEKDIIVTQRTYTGQMTVLFSDCPSLKKKIETADYSLSAIRSVVSAYNNCIAGGPAEYVSKEKKVRLKAGIIAGITDSKLKFTGTYSTPLADVVFPATWSYVIGVSLDIVLPYLQGSWIIYNDITYMPYKATGSIQTQDNFITGIYTNYNFTFDMGYLKLTTLIRYQYPAWKVKPFINIGMSNGYAVKAVTTMQQELHEFKTVTVTESNALDDVRKYEMGLVVGIGLHYWHMGAEFRFENANGMSPYTALISRVNTLMLQVSFIF